MIVLNIGLKNSPGWDLVPSSVKEAYLITPPFGGKKIVLHEEDFSLSPEEVRDIFLLCRNSKFYEFHSLDIFCPWKIYPHAYIVDGGRVSPQEMYQNLEKGVFPIGFVDYDGNVIYF